ITIQKKPVSPAAPRKRFTPANEISDSGNHNHFRGIIRDSRRDVQRRSWARPAANVSKKTLSRNRCLIYGIGLVTFPRLFSIRVSPNLSAIESVKYRPPKASKPQYNAAATVRKRMSKNSIRDLELEVDE